MKKNLLFAILFFSSFTNFAQDKNVDISNYLDVLINKNVLLKNDAKNFKITDKHISKQSQVSHIYYRQSYQNIEIVGTESGLHTLPNGQIIASSNKFISNIEEKIASRASSFISPENAVLRVAQQMNYTISESLKIVNNSVVTDNNTTIFSSAGISKRAIPVKKIYYSKEYEKPVLAYELSIYELSGQNWYNFYVNAETGNIIKKNNWKVSCDIITDSDHKIASNHNSTILNSENKTVVTDATSTYNVFALPIENPFFGPRTLEVDPHNLTASPFGWHDTNGVIGAEYTVTRGNNVNAYEDGDNFGHQPDGGANLVFDFPFNETYSFSNQSEDAAITNLFYWSNVIHDVLYVYGFDEESGNFQVNNYSGLGVGNDQVNAEAQDNSGTCNANFFTPPDGSSGVMQMYTCDFRDGDFDNQVIAHEYGHGISNRLTGGASNVDCLFNDEQMGEGWSDWYGSVLTMTSSDVSTDLQPVGNWLFGQPQNGPGIRDYPYTTDLSQDPRTYDYIKNTFGPHPLGSTWAAMLWELTWGLIGEHGFDEDVYNGTGGNNIALALVTEALKLQPCSPGFVDGRDAILAADIALYSGANQCIIWDAFAKRGLGFSASQGSSNSRIDGTEAFDGLSTNLNIEEESFCFFENPIVLNGGFPVGGVYSGLGVTDNGDGLSFTFNPTIAGIGFHTITYAATSICTVSGLATDVIEVTNGQPEINCQDISITLNELGTATIVPEDIVTNFLPGDGYTLDQTGTFNLENISANGIPVSLSDDQVSSQLTIGFDFTFYGNTYNTFAISSNGFITFDNNGFSGCCSGQNIPNTGFPNNLIAFAWTDLFPPGNGSIKYATIGTAPNRILVVDAVNIPFCCNSTAQVTSQVKLFEGSNKIEIHNTSVNGFSMTQGIENSNGTSALPVPDRNSQSFTIANDFVAFLPNAGGFPNNCGLETTVTLDIDTFNCSNIGQNTVTTTVTDTNGNSSSCTSTVTVLPNNGVEFNLNSTTFCDDQTLVTGLTGGTPVGGVYSGIGVTDNGNGTTFSLNPSVSGVGTINYQSTNSCATTSTASVEIEVLPAIPSVLCQNITLPLGLNGTANIALRDVLIDGNILGGLYALNPFSANGNIARYNYNSISDSIEVDTSFSGSTQIERNFALDANPTNGGVYILSGISNTAPRQLFSFDIAVANGGASLIETITSVTGDTNPQAMTFGSNGTLYFVFNNGEINAYNVNTQVMTPLATISSVASVGITFDYDNNRLIHSTGTGTLTLTAINITTGIATSLFTISTGCGAQAIEYVGNNKVIVSSTNSCNTIYTIDLATQQMEVLLNPSGTFTSIKDIMYIGNLPVDNCNGEALTFTLNPTSFDCSNIGANTVTISATDNQGNQTSCSSIVTIIDNLAPEVNCVSNLAVILDENENASITQNDIILSGTDNCDNDITYNISQTDFDCNDIMTNITIDLISNGSFENGLTSWNSTIENGTEGGFGSCQQKWYVDINSFNTCCCVSDILPTDGNFAAFTSFDNNTPNTIYTLEQTVNLPSIINTIQFTFDWRGEFDLLNYGATMNRTFSVTLYDNANNLIGSVYNYQIPAFLVSSINENVSIDLSNQLLPFAGQNVKLVFTAIIPKGSVGPSKALVDNVKMLTNGTTNNVAVSITATDNFGNSSVCNTIVEVTDPNGNCDLSTDSFELNGITIYPNPVKDVLTISWLNKPDSFQIFDINGKLINTTDLQKFDTEASINTASLSNGVYIIKVKTNDNKVLVKRIIKE